MVEFPRGTVTFLFTDIEGSTRLLQSLGECYPELLSKHNELLRSKCRDAGGVEVGSDGDALFFAFGRATDALSAAVAAQRAIAAHPWPRSSSPRVRMGIHTGQPDLTDAGYVGLDLHRVARVTAAAHGGQVLLTQSTLDLVAGSCPEGTGFKELGEHFLNDLEQPLRLYQVLAPGLQDEFPAVRSLNAEKNNLPRQLSSFVGRRREIEEILSALGSSSLTTLVGMGGAGKSRLALQVAAEGMPMFPDGVWLVKLAGLSDPARVAQAVAGTLGVREQPGRALLVTLCDALAPKSLLLVLDNCEHLLEECAGLAVSLLDAAPHLKILATSREPLGVPGEMAYAVPPLALPEYSGPPQPKDLLRCESAALFVERARLVNRQFEVTGQNSEAVARLCGLLDGIPLAIELAAAWTRMLPVDQILQRLQGRLPQLSDRQRASNTRHRTLEASMDWSFNPLAEAEKAVLRRLSVFAGGFSLEAVEAVCVGDPVDQDDVLDLLARLVDKSLALVERQNERVRYRLHEIVRQYGGRRLDEADEAAIFHHRHIDYFVGFAEAAEAELKGAGQPAWLDRLEQDHDNLRVAFERARSAGDDEARLRLATALWRFCEVRGYVTEGRELLGAAITAGVQAPLILRAKALDADGRLAWRQGGYEGAVARFQESLALWREAGDRAGEANALHGLARAKTNLGRYEEARALAAESLALEDRLGDPQGIATSLNTLGEIARAEGDYERAAEHYDKCLGLFRRIGDAAASVSMLHNLGHAALARGRDREAEDFFAEALRLAAGLKDQMGVCHMLSGLAGVATHRGHAPCAAWLLGAAERARDLGGYIRERVDQAAFDRDLATTRRALDDATFQELWARGGAAPLDSAVAFALSAETNVPSVTR